MKIKKKTAYLICILSLMIFSLTLSNVAAINFSFGFVEEEEIIWKCRINNSVEMNNIFGFGWDSSGLFQGIEQGALMKWKLSSITNNGTSFNLEFNTWSWRIEEDWSGSDGSLHYSFYTNPVDYPDNLNFSMNLPFLPFIFPIPIGDYLEGLNLSNLYNMDTRVLSTINIVLPRDFISTDLPSQDVNIIAIYNGNGILNFYKIYLGGFQVILDVSLNQLPPYVIPALILLFAIFAVGLIYYLFKIRDIKF